MPKPKRLTITIVVEDREEFEFFRALASAKHLGVGPWAYHHRLHPLFVAAQSPKQ